MHYDIAVVGAGPAGLAFARSLDGTGLRIALIERAPLAALADPRSDGREIALTHRSVRTLQQLRAWQHIPAAEIAPLRGAQVLNGASRFALTFDSRASGADRLGQLVPNHCIRRALYDAAIGQPGLDLIAGTEVTTVATSRRCATVTLGDGRTLSARLLVAADSRFSQVRDQLGIDAEVNRLGRSMMVCRVSHPLDHRGIATEWFDHGQTIAMLPLSGHQSSAVLTLPAAEIDRLAALDPVALGQELTRRYQNRLGRMEVLTAPHVYPLATTYARRFATTRAALIGDAAVGMHPVTAHGFNLGLRGAASLGALVRDAAARGGDIGGPILLRRFDAGHRVICRFLYMFTNAVVSLYTAEKPPFLLARHAVLRAGHLPAIRTGIERILAQHG